MRITIAGQPLAWVSQFKYLGSMFSSDGGLDAELSYRCRRAGAAFRRLNKPVFRHSQVSLPIKMRIHRAMVERLELVQRKQLRQVLGRSRWRPRAGSSFSQISNEQLLAACEQPTIEQRLQRLQGRWVGHVLRMPNYRLARQLFFGAMLSAAPPQNPLPYPHTLIGQYAKTAHAAYPLRKLETPDFMVAAADKPDLNWHFP